MDDNHTTDISRSKQSLRVWLKLLGSTNHVASKVRERLRVDFATTLPRFDVLAELSRRPNGVTMGELSSMLMVSNGNLTGLAKRLQNDGLILRSPMPTDKRTHILFITSKGRTAFKAMALQHEKWVEALFSDLADKDITALLTILSKIKYDGMQTKNITESDL
jgi:DNA-binding MarR family transcriptional regulator